MPQHSLPPMEKLMDLFHEVRQVSRDLQQSAKRSAQGRSYAETLQTLVDSRMQGPDPHARIVCYASASELGVSAELATEHCRQVMSGGLGFPLRVLFWAAHRRMHARRHPRSGTWSKLG